MQNLPIEVAAESSLGQLLAALEAAEAAANAQRVVVAAARDSYAAEELRQRRQLYASAQPESTELKEKHAHLIALQATRDLEDERLNTLLTTWRVLRGRWEGDYAEFLKLQRQCGDLQRLAG